MAQTYPPPSISGLEGASLTTIEADASSLLSILDKHPSLPIFTRSTSGFESVRQTCNSNVTTQPLAIVRPRTEAEVSSVVIHCVGHSPRIRLAIRTGGHDMWERSLVEDGVVIDLRALDQVEVAEDKSSARIGGGIMGGALIRQLETLGLSTPTGFCTGVGYAGWALGGGYGVLQGKYGLGCDQILAARVVTACGEVVDTKDDSELLWALRGAGNGNFGVVVELTIKVYPRPAMLGGYLAYPLADAKNVFAKFQESIADEFPDEFSGDFLCGDVPGLGQTILMLHAWVQEDGDLSKAKAHLEKFQGIGDILLNTVIETTPCGFASSIDPVAAVRLPYHFRTRTVKGITPELVQIFLETEGTIGPSHIISHHAHGAAIKPSPESCFVNRMPHIVLGFGAAPPPPHGPRSPEMDAARAYSNDLATKIKERGMALDSAYMNFSPPEECDTELFYGKETMERLKALKRRYDGANIFFKAYPPLA
ncbi:hypothetical protein G7Z17_g13423 [Cylindrodendrum hubeiense]|uniref:FAD-binding PCMH-type domain-containing protein n=1 Tax=Cylindrodendrum hubeiense TaxID=595255 RepID=A0A9P5H001_9HYPO|nr:hypothetical protein G7Z17_g13423 [Cylindrodendrum hubeiense]